MEQDTIAKAEMETIITLRSHLEILRRSEIKFSLRNIISRRTFLLKSRSFRNWTKFVLLENYDSFKSKEGFAPVVWSSKHMFLNGMPMQADGYTEKEVNLPISHAKLSRKNSLFSSIGSLNTLVAFEANYRGRTPSPNVTITPSQSVELRKSQHPIVSTPPILPFMEDSFASNSSFLTVDVHNKGKGRDRSSLDLRRPLPQGKSALPHRPTLPPRPTGVKIVSK